MSTNPDNAIGTNGAYSGRTSVNAFNDNLSVYSRGILSGWSCVVSSGLTVALGGENGIRDVAVATDNNGNNTTINNISETPVQVTLSSAPATDSRIDAIVAYVDNPPTGISSVADNPSACGLIVVKGTANSSPVEPDDSAIRTAITTDGASGTTAYYVILAEVTIASGTTDLDDSMITQGVNADMNGGLLAQGSVKGSSIDWDSIKSQLPFIITNNVKTNMSTQYFTSDKGNTYGIEYINGGSGIKITSGGANINKVVTNVSFLLAARYQNNNLGVHGVESGIIQSVYFMNGLSGTTVITPTQVQETPTTIYQTYPFPATISPNYQGAVARVEWTRTAGTNRWNGFYDISYYMANVQVSGLIKVEANANDVVPTLYFPGVGGATAGNPTDAYQSIEIYE